MLCRCNCGNITSVRLSYLKNAHTKSCGCLQRKISRERHLKDISGQVFGRLTAIRRVDEKQRGRKTYWECKCQCGNTIIVSYSNLTTGNTSSCGCLISKGEESIRKILMDNNVRFGSQYKFSDLLSPDRNYPLKFDFAIFDHNDYVVMLIEFDGKQHFRPMGFSSDAKMNEKKLMVAKRNDKLKNEYCKKNGFSLFRIPYTYEEDVEKLLLQNLKSKGVI